MSLILSVKNDGKRFAFVERYSVYCYRGKGHITSLCAVTKKGIIAPSYAFKRESFINLKEIDKTVGIDSYLKAKKALYSIIGQGFIVEMRIGVDFTTGKYLEKNTYVKGFTVKPGSRLEDEQLEMVAEKASPQLLKLVERPMKILLNSSGDRVKYLRLRGELNDF
jgi:hypothetical protein